MSEGKNINSGFLDEPLESVDNEFTDLKILYESDINLIVRGRRYGRLWILKALKKDVRNNTTALIRLRKEFEILMELNYPGIISVSGMEDIPEYGPCIIMEYIDGVTLDEWLKTSPPLKTRREVGRKLADTVEYIHSKGVVHRDLKPTNIMVTRNGNRVVLIDFGLADTDSHVVLKNPAGTPGYMSEEQKTQSVADLRNDIYSLGIILKEMDLHWKGIVKKCQMPADKRYQSVKDLKTDIMFNNSMSKALWIVTIICLAVCIVVLVIRMASNEKDRTKHENIETSTKEEKDSSAVSAGIVRSDSTVTDPVKIDISGDLSKSQEDLSKPPSSENQPISETITNARNNNIDAAIKDGLTQLNSRWSNYPWWRHVDTLTNLKYLDEGLEYYDKDIEDFPKKYVTSLGNRFTEEELNAIQYKLESEDSKWRQKVYKKLERVKESHDLTQTKGRR